MSPASSGNLEVERYIGACLFSSQTRHKGPKPGGYQNVPGQRCPNAQDRWIGGVPLISFANQKWRSKNGCKGDEGLSRLVVHTQGAPLILSSRYHNRGKGKPNQKKPASDSVDKPSVDTASVTSDESSGSNNTETCLPRIIKPRKRRKKDRKPPHLANSFPPSPETNNPDIGFGYGYTYAGNLVNYPLNGYQRIGANQTPKQPPVSAPKKNPEPDLEISETPKLHHSFEDVEELEDINGNASSCQCRYCDPSGQIWDIDRSCYSPYLTPFQNLKTPTLENATNSIIKAISSFSLEDDNSSSASSPRSSRDLDSGLSSSPALTGSPFGSPMNPFNFDHPFHKSPTSLIKEKDPPRDLKISTEIVTSLNGHRDLEIKFSLTPSPSFTDFYQNVDPSKVLCVNKLVFSEE